MAEMVAGFGPWVSGLAEGERVARLREMRALALVFCAPSHPLVSALRQAELDPAAAERALELLDALPALPRQGLLATRAALRVTTQRKAAS